MRYWIYWNDLIQGPFELDELTALKAFNEDLLVCLEDRAEWIPACRIADLSPAIEQLRASRLPPPPPPPPPSRPPARDAIQGEFFTEAPQQDWLFPEDGPRQGPFAFSSQDLQNLARVLPEAHFTMPFRFQSVSPVRPAPSSVAVLPPPVAPSLPAPQPLPPGALDALVWPRVETMPPTVIRESPVPAPVEPPVQTPGVRIPLEIYPTSSEEAVTSPSTGSVVDDIPLVPSSTIVDSPAESATVAEKPTPVEAPSEDAVSGIDETVSRLLEPEPESSGWRVAAWASGVVLALALMAGFARWWFDFSTSRSAIEAVRGEQMSTRASQEPVVPVTPSPVAGPVAWPRPQGTTHLSAVPNPRVEPARNPGTALAHPVVIKSSSTSSKKMPARKTKRSSAVGTTVAESAKQKPGVIAPPLFAQNPAATPVPGPTGASAMSAASKSASIPTSASRAAAPIPHISAAAPASPAASTPASTVIPTPIPSVAAKSASSVASASAPSSTSKAGVSTPPAPVVPPISSAAPPTPVSSVVAKSASSAASASAPAAASNLASTARLSTPPPDPWIGRHNEAITLVEEKKIAGGQQTVAARARVMLEVMHDKELLHAADTGERLYLPDKISWSALREEGARYRVYLGFSALQSNGDRVQARAYQFLADLQLRSVLSDDASAQADFLKTTVPLTHVRDARAEDIENILSAVDHLNKQKMRAIIVRNNRKNRDELKKINSGINAATQKFLRALAYFRTTYPESILQNIAKAYDFTRLLKDTHV